MEHENDEWLEQQLKAKPLVDQDDFSGRVMAEIEQYCIRKQEKRKTILQATYAISIILFVIVTPWDWLFSKVNDTQGQMASLIASDTTTQFPVVALAIFFVISFTIFVFGQETN